MGQISFDTIEAQASRMQAAVGNMIRLLIDEIKSRDAAIEKLKCDNETKETT